MSEQNQEKNNSYCTSVEPTILQKEIGISTETILKEVTKALELNIFLFKNHYCSICDYH